MATDERCEVAEQLRQCKLNQFEVSVDELLVYLRLDTS